MKLVIIKDNFDIKRIVFRDNKLSKKISYDINNISMIGITININYDNLIDKGNYIILKVNEKDKVILYKIDNYFKSLFNNYDKIVNNDIIRVKKHKEYIYNPLNKNILITMNSIKKDFSGKVKVQIFTI